MLRIILIGATGAMGRTIADLVKENEDYKIVAGLADKTDMSRDFSIYDKFEDIKEEGDVIIDFSSRFLLDQIIEFAKTESYPVVFATTGYTDEDLEKINKLGESAAFIQEGNYSLGINVMTDIAERLARALKDFDIEIVESHHNKKKDNPSGTANMIFDGVNRGRDGKLFKKMRDFSHDDRRDPNEVGISSVRAGTIVGEHRLILAGLDETVEIKHQAASKKIFANGALKAASFLVGKKPGRYYFKDVIRGDND